MGRCNGWAARGLAALELCATLGCGRVSRDQASPAQASGGVAATNGGGTTSAGGASPSDGAGPSGGVAAGGDDAPYCGFSNIGGAATNGGSTSVAGVPSVDPQVSESWSFSACGVIPPSSKKPLQAVFPQGVIPLAVLFDDGSIELEPVTSTDVATVIRPGGSPLQAIAFSPDGSQRAEANAGVVQLFHPLDGAEPTPIELSSGCTGNTLRFSADSRYILAWDTTSLCVWQIETGALVQQLAGAFTSAALNGGRLLTAESGQPPTVKSWAFPGSTSTSVTLELPEGPATERLLGITVSPRADTFAAFSYGPRLGTVANLWSADGKLLGTFPNTSYATYATTTAYSESGAFVSAGDELVDVASGQARHDTPKGLDITTIDDIGGRVAGIESVSGGVQVYDLTGASGPRLFASLPQSAEVTDIAISPDGTRLAITALGGGLLWRVAPDFVTSEAIHSLNVAVQYEANFTTNGRQLLISGDGWAAVSADDGQELPQPNDISAPPPNVPATDDQMCVHTSARVSSRGTWLAFGTWFKPSTQILDWSNCPNPSLLLSTAHCNARTAFSADDSLIATTGPALFRTRDGSRIWPTNLDSTGPGDLFGDVQFMPGEQALLASNCPGSVFATAPACSYALYSVSDGSLIQALPELSGAQAAISAEGHWLVSGGTALHLPSGETRSFDPDAVLATFAPNGDIIAVRKDNSIARYCRSP